MKGYLYQTKIFVFDIENFLHFHLTKTVQISEQALY